MWTGFWLMLKGAWKAVNGILSIIPPALFALALVLALGATWAQKSRFDGLTKQVADDKKARSVADAQAQIDKANAIALAVKAAKTESEQLQKVKDDALQKANQLLLIKTADATRARSELASLRDQSARDRLRMSQASKQALANYAITASELLDECSQRYQELADKADGHAIDAGMIEAWPVITPTTPTFAPSSK